MSDPSFTASLEALRRRLSAIRADGETFPTRQPAALSELLDGLRDDLERLRTEGEALAAACQFYQHLFGLAPDGHLVTDAHGVIREANRAAGVLLGADGQTLVGHALADFVPEAEREWFRTDILQLAGQSDGDASREWLVSLQPLRGKPFASALTVASLCPPGGGSALLNWSLRDIARRKELEDSLRGTEARLRAVLDTAFNAMLLVSEQGAVESVNPAAERMFGYAAAELLGRDPAVLWPAPPGDDLSGARGAVRELTGRRKDGTTFLLEAAVSEVRLDDRRLTLVIARDLTDRRRAEEALRRSEEHARLLIDTAPVAIWMAGPDGACSYVNKVWLEFTGRSLAEELGDGWVVSVHPEDRPGAVEAFRGALAARQPFLLEYRLRRADGVYGWVLDTGRPRFTPSGDFAGYLGSVIDISERKRAEEALQEREEHFRSLVEVAECMIVIMRPDLTLAYFSPYAETLTGYRAEEVLGRSYVEVFLTEPETRAALQEAVERAFAGAPAQQFEHAVCCKAGHCRQVVWNAQRLANYGGGPAVLAVGLDITGLKEAQERAVQAERLAAIGQMVAGLAHESGNALMRIQAGLERLARRVRGQPDAEHLLAEVQRAGDHLHHLHEEVRTYAAPVKLEPRACDLAAVWREAWADLEPRRRGRRAALREGPGCDGLAGVVDPFRLGQVFRNVLDNALAATPDPVEIEVRSDPAELDGRPAVRVTVTDNGPGLAPEQRDRAFDPFYTTKTQGTGLGLAIARRIVEAHGGRIAAGGPGPGATIEILLPWRKP